MQVIWKALSIRDNGFVRTILKTAKTPKTTGHTDGHFSNRVANPTPTQHQECVTVITPTHIIAPFLIRDESFPNRGQIIFKLIDSFVFEERRFLSSTKRPSRIKNSISSRLWSISTKNSSKSTPKAAKAGFQLLLQFTRGLLCSKKA